MSGNTTVMLHPLDECTVTEEQYQAIKGHAERLDSLKLMNVVLEVGKRFRSRQKDYLMTGTEVGVVQQAAFSIDSFSLAKISISVAGSVVKKGKTANVPVNKTGDLKELK